MILEWLGNWLKQIILLIVIATFIDLILPNRSMERYVKLVMGLLMIMVILTPILQLIGKDKALTNWGVEFWNQGGKGEIKSDQYPTMKEIEASSQLVKQKQEDFVRQRVNQQIEQMVIEQVESRFSVKVHHCDVRLKEEAGELRLERIRLILSSSSPKSENSGVSEVEPVKPVEIGKGEEIESGVFTQKDDEWIKRISRYIAETWQLNLDNIEIRVQA